MCGNLVGLVDNERLTVKLTALRILLGLWWELTTLEGVGLTELSLVGEIFMRTRFSHVARVQEIMAHNEGDTVKPTLST